MFELLIVLHIALRLQVPCIMSQLRCEAVTFGHIVSREAKHRTLLQLLPLARLHMLGTDIRCPNCIGATGGVPALQTCVRPQIETPAPKSRAQPCGRARTWDEEQPAHSQAHPECP